MNVSTPQRTRPAAPSVEPSRRAELYLSDEELARAAGISVTTLARLVSLGLVDPIAPGFGSPTFSAATAERLRRMLRLHRVEQLQPVEPTALQPDVEINQAGSAARDMRQRVVAVTRRARDVAFVLQDAGNQFPDVRFVVDYQNVIGHGCHALVASCGACTCRAGWASLVPAACAARSVRC